MNDPQTVHLQTVLETIAGGAVDDQLHRIALALKERRKIVQNMRAAEIGATLAKGDVVMIREDAQIRPKYLPGTTWTVTEVKPSGKFVLMPEGATKFVVGRYQSGLVTDASILERVPDDKEAA